MKILIAVFILFSSVSGFAGVRCYVGNDHVNIIDLIPTADSRIAEIIVFDSRNRLKLRGNVSASDTRNRSTIFVRNAWNWKIEVNRYRELLMSNQKLSTNGTLDIQEFTSSGRVAPFPMNCQRN